MMGLAVTLALVVAQAPLGARPSLAEAVTDADVATLRLSLEAKSETTAARVLPEHPRIAMMPLSSLGSTDESAAAIEHVLVAELRHVLGPRLVTATELARDDLWLPPHLEACEGVLECLLDVFGGFGWTAFIVGNIAGLGADRVIHLKLIDVRTGGELRRATGKASGDEAGIIKQMRRAAVLLLAPHLLTGTVEVVAPQPGIRIFLDGQLVGTTPLASTRVAASEGRHAVEASGTGFVTSSQMVDVGYGEVVPLTIVLPASSVFVGGRTPYRHRWWTWVMSAAGLASLGAAAYFYHEHGHVADEMTRLAADGTLGAEHAVLRREWQRDLLLARLFGAGGGTLVLGVGTLFAVDLF